MMDIAVAVHHPKTGGVGGEHIHTGDTRLDGVVPTAGTATLQAHGGEIDVEHHIVLHTLGTMEVKVVLIEELLGTGYVGGGALRRIRLIGVVHHVIAIPRVLPGLQLFTGGFQGIALLGLRSVISLRSVDQVVGRSERWQLHAPRLQGY